MPSTAAGTVAVSSPEGNSLAVIDAASGKVVSTSALVEVCGVAPDGTGFMATTGAGEIVDGSGATRSEPDYVWDNHMLRIEPVGRFGAERLLLGREAQFHAASPRPMMRATCSRCHALPPSIDWIALARLKKSTRPTPSSAKLRTRVTPSRMVTV